MEDQCSPLSWGYYYPEDGIEELKHSLLYTTLELETTLLSTYEEIARKEDELIHLKDLLSKTIKERDEARGKCQMLKLEKLILQQQLFQRQQQLDGLTPTRNEDELKVDGGSKNSGENLTPLPVLDPIPPPLPQVDERLVVKKPLPENGKFLQAVMEAGPLLQTLLLAGPLPQWQHPPPQLKSVEIPPATIPSPAGRLLHRETSSSPKGNFCSKKRALVPCEEASDSSPNTKHPKVVHQSNLTNC